MYSFGPIVGPPSGGAETDALALFGRGAVTPSPSLQLAVSSSGLCPSTPGGGGGNDWWTGTPAATPPLSARGSSAIFAPPPHHHQQQHHQQQQQAPIGTPTSSTPNTSFGQFPHPQQHQPLQQHQPPFSHTQHQHHQHQHQHQHVPAHHPPGLLQFSPQGQQGHPQPHPRHMQPQPHHQHNSHHQPQPLLFGGGAVPLPYAPYQQQALPLLFAGSPAPTQDGVPTPSSTPRHFRDLSTVGSDTDGGGSSASSSVNLIAPYTLVQPPWAPQQPPHQQSHAAPAPFAPPLSSAQLLEQYQLPAAKSSAAAAMAQARRPVLQRRSVTGPQQVQQAPPPAPGFMPVRVGVPSQQMGQHRYSLDSLSDDVSSTRSMGSTTASPNHLLAEAGVFPAAGLGFQHRGDAITGPYHAQAHAGHSHGHGSDVSSIAGSELLAMPLPRPIAASTASSDHAPYAWGPPPPPLQHPPPQWLPVGPPSAPSAGPSAPVAAPPYSGQHLIPQPQHSHNHSQNHSHHHSQNHSQNQPPPPPPPMRAAGASLPCPPVKDFALVDVVAKNMRQRKRSSNGNGNVNARGRADRFADLVVRAAELAEACVREAAHRINVRMPLSLVPPEALQELNADPTICASFAAGAGTGEDPQHTAAALYPRRDECVLISLAREVLSQDGSTAGLRAYEAHDPAWVSFQFAVCADYLRGACSLGSQCRDVHVGWRALAAAAAAGAAGGHQSQYPPASNAFSSVGGGAGLPPLVVCDVHFNAALTMKPMRHRTHGDEGPLAGLLLGGGRRSSSPLQGKGNGPHDDDAHQPLPETLDLIAVRSQKEAVQATVATILVTRGSRLVLGRAAEAPDHPQVCSHYGRGMCPRGRHCCFVHAQHVTALPPPPPVASNSTATVAPTVAAAAAALPPAAPPSVNTSTNPPTSASTSNSTIAGTN